MEFVARHLTPARLFTICSILALAWGYSTPLQEFITPERGFGYYLGIIGGSMMLLVIVYPARKRIQSLAFLGSVPFWFRAHIVLGIVGPILVLFHSNFTLGAVNSNVALYCMLLVSGSGIVGRYFYSRVYDNLLGRQATVGEVQAVAEQLRNQAGTVAILPDLLAAIEREEKWLLEPAHGAFSRLFHPFTIGFRATLARRHLEKFIATSIARAARDSRPIAWQAQRLSHAAYRYACRRLDAQRRVAEYKLYAGLFSYWHVLHVPLFIMLLIASTVHIVSVHVY
jgi:hypothetical protein